MKKVLLIANDTTYTYNLRDELIERLIAERYDVIVAAKLLLYQEELRRMGCRLIDVDAHRHGANPFSELSLLRRYRQILKSENPDVALTFNIKPNVYGGIACQLFGCRYLSNITGLGTAVEYPGLMQKITIPLYRKGVAGAACIFFQNTENYQFFQKNHMLNQDANAVLIPGSGVNLRKHRELPYPTDSGTVNFLFIARIMAEKGIVQYLNAAKTIHSKYENVYFHICGSCDDEKYLHILSEAEKDGYIIYHGEQKDLTPFFEMAHCIVHPSFYPEGMSNVLLEAAAHCRPIITTDRAGCRETVDDGTTGFVVPVKDEYALVAAVDRFLALSINEKKKMGLVGRKKIEQEFDRQIVVNAYLKEMNTH